MEIESAPKLQLISSPPSGLRARLTGDLPTSSRARSLSVLRSMEATCPEVEQETKALVESGRMAMSSGWRQTLTAARTVGGRTRPAIDGTGWESDVGAVVC